MPWYDFRCEACDKEFEARLPVAARDEAQCPHCGSRRVERRLPLTVTVVPGRTRAVRAESGGCACGGGSCGCGLPE
jgi:putative FmdB family regulatory protein